MPPPFYVPGTKVTLYSDAALYPTLDDLCRSQNEGSVAPGEYCVVDVSRDETYQHDTHDGYFYRLFHGGEHAGWQWQDALVCLASEEVPQNEYLQEKRMEFLHDLERPRISTDWAYRIGQTVKLKSPLFCWKTLHGICPSPHHAIRLRASRVRIADRGALIADGDPPFEDATIEIESPLPVYLVADEDKREFWTCEPLLDAAKNGKEPNETESAFGL